MLLYVNTKSNLIIGTHGDHQDIDPALYGENIRVIPIEGNPPIRHGEMAPPATRNSLEKYTAFKSRKTQTKGVIVNGHYIRTDDPGGLTHIMQALDAGHLRLTTLKTKDGKFLQADGAMIDSIHAAVAKHLDSCRTMEHMVSMKIKDGEITTYDQVDSMFSSI